MRTKITLILLLLNVALFFFIFRFERRWRVEDSWKEARRRVLGAEAADIRSIEITSAARKLALARRGDVWFIAKPIDWPANPNAVSRIINELQFLEDETSFNVRDLEKSGQSLADYGLDQPKLTVAFSSSVAGAETSGPVTLLRLGDTTKDGIKLYLLSPDGQRIHVVSQSLARSLSLTFDELHADSVFTIPVFEARSLNLQTAAPASLRIRLRRDGNRWAFDTPIIARASKNATELTINALNGLRVKSFVLADAPSPLPAEKPTLRISLEGNNRRETLILGDEVLPVAPAAGEPATTITDKEYYAQLEGRSALFTFVMPGDLKRVLDRSQETLRESRLLEFDARAVTAITLTAPDQPPLTLQRLETGAPSAESAAWQIVLRGDGGQGPKTLPADRAAVTRLLERLSLVAAQTFQSDAPRDADLETWGFNRPERTVTLATPGQPPLGLEIALAAPRDANAFARLGATGPSVYGIRSDILKDLPVAPRAWRERLLRDLPPGARITGLKLTDLAENKTLLETAIDAVGRPVESTPFPEAVQTTLAEIRTLRAKSFVLDQLVDKVVVGGDERPWRYRLDASITLTGGAGQQTSTTSLLLSPRVGGDRQLAGSSEFNAVFEIEQPFIDALWKLTEGLRDPGPPPAPKADAPSKASDATSK